MNNKKRFSAMLKKEIMFIYENDGSFLREFALMECIDLIEIGFTDAPSVKFVYISSKGEHIADYVSFDDYYEWKDKITKRRENNLK